MHVAPGDCRRLGDLGLALRRANGSGAVVHSSRALPEFLWPPPVVYVTWFGLALAAFLVPALLIWSLPERNARDQSA